MHDNKQRLEDLKEEIVFSGVVNFRALVDVSGVSDAANEQLPRGMHYFGILIIDDYLDNAPTSEPATLATDWHKMESTVKYMQSKLENAKTIAAKYNMSLSAGSVSLIKNKYGTTIAMTVGISDNTYVSPPVKKTRARKPRIPILATQATTVSTKETSTC